MHNVFAPFLTALDSRADIKGSRDPIGCQAIWTRLGRYVIGNLSTVSTSVRDFTTLLLGVYLANQRAAIDGAGKELETFLKWEHLCAYVRVHLYGDKPRGVDRVSKNLNEGRYKVEISADRAHQILSDQKVYGIWGLYTVPAISSGLLIRQGGNPSLSDQALHFVESHYLKILGSFGEDRAAQLVERLKPANIKLSMDDELVSSLGKVLKRRILAEEERFYSAHLLNGGPNDATNGLQSKLLTLNLNTLSQDDFEMSSPFVKSLIKDANKRGDEWNGLSYRLSRILAAESILAPLSELFAHLLGCDGVTMKAIVERLNDTWGSGLTHIDAEKVAELSSDLGEAEESARWISLASALRSGDWKKTIALLLEQNKKVMVSRGGAPWVEDKNGTLSVRFRDEDGPLSSKSKVQSLWRYPYFIPSLRAVAVQVCRG